MNLNVFNLNLLRILDAILSERSVSRAASRLHLSQPAMSGSLARLREHFGDPLLIRSGKNMELTPRAQALAGPVHDLLRQVRSTLGAETEFEPAKADRVFKIDATDYVFAILLRRIIHEMRILSPDVSFQIETITDKSFIRLLDGEIDLCITTRGTFDAGNAGKPVRFHKEHVFSDGFVCVVDRKHPHIDTSITAEQLASLPQAILRLGPNMNAGSQMAWETVGLEPSICAALPSYLAIAQLIPGTDIIAMIPERLAMMLVTQLPLKIVGSPISFPRINEMMLWHERSMDDPVHVYLRQQIKACAALMRDPG